VTQVVFRKKDGTSERLDAGAGTPLPELLRRAGIPINAVLVRVNGQLEAAETARLEADDFVEISQVRHYDLDVTRRPPRKLDAAPNPVYTKSVLFQHHGTVEVCSEQLAAKEFLSYIEGTFVQVVEDSGMFGGAPHIVTGLSGGRDSVAFLKLLSRVRPDLPDFEMTAVTVTGLPDWEEPATLDAALAVARGLGIEHVFVRPEEIEQTFQLCDSLEEAMNVVAASVSSDLVMVFVHHIMRRMVEVTAAQRGTRTVALGLNADDLVSSLVTWFTSGYQMGEIPIRNVGSFRYLFPLYRITKKELTLYLELVDQTLSRQGSPGRFTTGPRERSLAYAITDHLLDLWPGIDYYLFDAFARMQAYFAPAVTAECEICRGTFQLQRELDMARTLCDVCEHFVRMKLSRPT
jgi:tRNA(Ile)-lysidine synthase TilS/MesJ